MTLELPHLSKTLKGLSGLIARAAAQQLAAWPTPVSRTVNLLKDGRIHICWTGALKQLPVDDHVLLSFGPRSRIGGFRVNAVNGDGSFDLERTYSDVSFEHVAPPELTSCQVRLHGVVVGHSPPLAVPLSSAVVSSPLPRRRARALKAATS